VNRDEIQRLMSSYATGSLTENERKLLYDAALEDQDLFDQLAHEHALKELIDEPGARDRLIAGLAPAEGAVSVGGWKKPLAWGLATSFVVGMSITAVMLTRSSLQTQTSQIQVAELKTPPLPASTVSSPPPPATPPPPVAAQPREKKATETDAKQLSDAKQLPTDKLKRVRALELAPQLQKEERKDAPAGSPAAVAPPPPPPSRPPENAVVVGQLQAPPAMQAPPTIQPQGFLPAPPAPGQIGPAQAQQAQDRERQATRSQTTESSTLARGGTGGGGGGGVGGRAASAAGLARRAEKADAPARFSFDYALEGEDLVFKFAADGYFSLHIAPGGLTIVDARVTAGSTRRERVNSNGTEADIVFSAAPQSTGGGIKLTSTLKADTIEDPAGTRIEVLVRFYPPPY
jgi:hypothetical protein